MMLNSSKAPLTLSNPRFPHWAMKEDVYDGYRTLEGATVIGNIFLPLHVMRTYTPTQPERFLGPSPQADPHKFVFGFGRCACPGMYFAEASVYLHIACILAEFTISKPLDEKGEEITPPASLRVVVKSVTLNRSSADLSRETEICWQLSRSNPNAPVLRMRRRKEYPVYKCNIIDCAKPVFIQFLVN
ncbi:hypothetical protein M405DRAFT_759980 [Rhizopogon salebrosus TDB-379]|nr:hypothetical protein M405DRAFT_759980 [Rhizopogon salebrosus TDB-379]